MRFRAGSRQIALLLFAVAGILLSGEAAQAVSLERQKLSLTLPDGKVLEANLRVPTVKPGQVKSKVPAVIVFGGFEHAAEVLELIDPPAPVVLASFDYPYSPPRKFEFPGSLKHAPEARQAVHETFEGARALAEALRAREDVDAGRISILGASFGAPIAVAAAAADPRLAGVLIIHGFGRVPETAMKQLLRRWEPRFGIWAKPMAWLLCQASWLYLGAPNPEASAAALQPSQKVLFLSAAEDSFIPRESSDSLWSAIDRSAAQKERIEMPGDHLQPGSDRLLSEITGKVLVWMRAHALL